MEAFYLYLNMETVVIRTFYNSIPAQITAGKLEEAGVESFIFGEGAVSMLSFSNSPNGGIQLVVNKKDEEEARQLLYEFDEAYRKTAVCPRCGANEIMLLPKDHGGSVLSNLVHRFFSVNPKVELVYKCNRCGNETDTLPEPPEGYFSKDLL